MEENQMIDVKSNTDDNEKWILCCSSIHKVEVVFFSQIIFLFLIAVFSMVQIINKSDNVEIYFSLLSTCIGVVVPSPSLAQSKK